MKITTTQTAYVSSAYDMGRFVDAVTKGDHEGIATRLVFTECDMTDSGWTKVGTAEITIELLDPKEIQNKQLAVLQAQLQKERADSQVRQNAILEAISKLTALEYEVTA